MRSLLVYGLAAGAEIAGCFSFWAWLRLGRAAIWIVPGMVALALFAWLLTLIDANAAGRAYAAYGGIYICGSLLWLWAVEDTIPDRWDLCGAALCLLGTLVILLSHRSG